MTDQPLWAPSPERAAASNMAAFMKFVNERHGTKLADYAALHRWSVDSMEEFWVAVWDFCGVIAETRGRDGHRRQGEDARGALLSRGAAQLRREPPSPFGPARGRDRLLGRGPRAHAPYACAAARRRVAHAAGPRRRGREGGRPGRRVHAQHARDGRRHAGRGEPGRHVHLVLARLRRAGRGRPLRAGRAARPRVLRRLLLQRQGERVPAAHRRDRGAAAHRGARRGRALRLGEAGHRGRPARGAARGLPRALRAEGPLVRAPAVQPPALHPLLQRHDRRSQVHRARRRRRAPHAPEGARAPLRREAGRPPLLLHHLRLDDVELARLGPGRGRDPAPLRRLPVPRARQRPLRLRGRRGHDPLRHLRQVHRRARQGGTGAGPHAPAHRAARDALDGLAARAGGLRLRLREREEGPLPVVHQRRHGPRGLLRRRRADPAGLARRAAVPRCSG